MLDEEHLGDAIKTCAKNPQALKLLWHFIEISGCFRQGISKDERLEIYNRGYGDFGLYIRGLLLEYAPKAYMNLAVEEINKSKEEKDVSK